MKIVFGAVILVLLTIGAPSAFAQMGAPLSKHPISDTLSGYNDGISDAYSCELNNCHLYILESGKGFQFHSWDFVRGYIIGWV